jgi:hypothetical protein
MNWHVVRASAHVYAPESAHSASVPAAVKVPVAASGTTCDSPHTVLEPKEAALVHPRSAHAFAEQVSTLRSKVGSGDGLGDGSGDGCGVGWRVGSAVGAGVGCGDGSGVGWLEGK